MPTYAAPLRGINVGGKSLIRMTDLKACFEDGGFDDVATYIASGNVLFGSTERGAAALTRRIERMLADRFELDVPVVLRTRAQMRSVVEDAPRGFGDRPEPIPLRRDLPQVAAHPREGDGGRSHP